MSLNVPSCNLRRVINILGVKELIKAVAWGGHPPFSNQIKRQKDYFS